MGKSRNNKARLYAVDKERQLGIVGATSALDWFTNMAARTGFGTPNLAESADYELVRFSYDYWKLITLYRNHWISRRIVDVPAGDMIRAWPRLTSDISPEDVGNIEKLIRKTYTRASLLKTMQWARLFGGAGALIVIDGQEEYLDEPLELEDVKLDSYKGVIPFDRWAGITPDGDVCTDINRPTDFNKPEFYAVHNNNMETFKVHSSRILRFNGPEVPTPEREAQSWWGISCLEPVYEEIRKRDNMSWNILSLTFRANILGMKYPELAQLISGVGIAQGAKQKLAERMEQINHLMSNQSLIPLPAEGGLESTQYSFTGLSEVYQQFQLDISGAAEMPVTRLWGRTISGLGQSNDADERIYEEKIGREQETDLRPQLEKLYPVMCMSELGEVPDDLDLAFPSVRVLDEKEKSELAKTVVDTVTVAFNSGGISPKTYAQELKQSSDITGIFTNITDEQIEKMSDEIQSGAGEMGAGAFGEGGEGGEGGAPQLSPSSSPQKVLRASSEGESGAEDVSHSQDWLDGYHAAAADSPFRQSRDAAEFKESEHPRGQPGNAGQFGSKGGGKAVEMPAHMTKFKKEDHKNASQFIQAALKENVSSGQQKYSNQDIAQAAQSLFGNKTSAFTVNGYKHKVYMQSEAGKAMLVAKKKGVEANNKAIEAAPDTGKAVTEAVQDKDKVTMYVKAWGSSPKTQIPGQMFTYIKVENVPSGMSTKETIKAYLEKQGYNLSGISNWDPSKPAPSNLKTFTPSDSDLKDAEKQVKTAEEAKIAQTAADKEAKQIATVTHTPLTADEIQAVKRYSNGAYSSLNSALREGKSMSINQAILAKQLDHAVSKATISSDRTLYRGISVMDIAAVIGSNPKIGDVVMDHGFMSTSKRSTSGFYTDAAIQLDIHVKKGQAGLDIQQNSNHSSENEVLLPRGSLFKIKSMKSDKKGHAKLEIEYVTV